MRQAKSLHRNGERLGSGSSRNEEAIVGLLKFEWKIESASTSGGVTRWNLHYPPHQITESSMRLSHLCRTFHTL